MSTEFTLEIFEPGKVDVFVGGSGSELPVTVLETLDRARIRVIGEPAGRVIDTERRRVLQQRCAGIISASPEVVDDSDRRAPRPWLPVDADPKATADFVAAVLDDKHTIRSYAFFIGRLERDFSHARQAIRAAVEAEAGIPCLWIDDGCHSTNVAGVREQTRLLLKYATFVIADLTLGVESPERENPSRAHEIGMAIAYGRPLMLCSQEPRRYPYFSIGDMQMTFWLTENELTIEVARWVAIHRNLVACNVFNYDLPSAMIARPMFSYDSSKRYIGPKTKVESGLRRLLSVVGKKPQ